ncbi:SDR family oxidoreductase [Streptomyces flavidovirens]|uniref:SDR family oxidoreductase n=1 Tax=Streptomyces flavidovirens TaxID=67298 RepID=UPI0033BF49D1
MRGCGAGTREVRDQGRRCLLLPGDLAGQAFCREAVERTVAELGGLSILVSNAAYLNSKLELEQLTAEDWDRTFQTNVYASSCASACLLRAQGQARALNPLSAAAHQSVTPGDARGAPRGGGAPTPHPRCARPQPLHAPRIIEHRVRTEYTGGLKVDHLRPLTECPAGELAANHPDAADSGT